MSIGGNRRHGCLLRRLGPLRNALRASERRGGPQTEESDPGTTPEAANGEQNSGRGQARKSKRSSVTDHAHGGKRCGAARKVAILNTWTCALNAAAQRGALRTGGLLISVGLLSGSD
jgi:hypothetical protein